MTNISHQPRDSVYINVYMSAAGSYLLFVLPKKTAYNNMYDVRISFPELPGQDEFLLAMGQWGGRRPGK